MSLTGLIVNVSVNHGYYYHTVSNSAMILYEARNMSTWFKSNILNRNSSYNKQDALENQPKTTVNIYMKTIYFPSHHNSMKHCS